MCSILNKEHIMLANKLELNEHKQKVAKAYNLAAAGYDKLALQFFPRTARRLVKLAHIREGEHVLDVGTGTGAAAFAAAENVGRTGKVVGVDIGEEILTQARQKLESEPQQSISFALSDMEQLRFTDASFDVVLSASTLFFLQDMSAGLREWQRVLKPGGRVAVSGYGEAAFRPMSDLFEARIRSYGVKFASNVRPFSWQRLTDPEQYLLLFRNVGMSGTEVFVEQFGYYLKNADEWWDIIWNSGFRGSVSQLSPEALEQFKAEHLAEVSKLETARGLWLDISAIFAMGRTP
jgi:arsenite methyltransferase